VSNDESQKNKEGEASPQPEQSRAIAQREEPSVPQQLQILVDLEKQRIDSYNRRTDAARYAIEMNDAADKRQFEYRMAELDAGNCNSTSVVYGLLRNSYPKRHSHQDRHRHQHRGRWLWRDRNVNPRCGQIVVQRRRRMKRANSVLISIPECPGQLPVGHGNAP
jgi:hypothetical protein